MGRWILLTSDEEVFVGISYDILDFFFAEENHLPQEDVPNCTKMNIQEIKWIKNIFSFEECREDIAGNHSPAYLKL